MYILVVLLAWLGIFMVTFEVTVRGRNKREAISWLCIFAAMTVFVALVLAQPSLVVAS